MDDLSDRRPIYRRLRDQIAAEIGRNTWPMGDPISTEFEFAKRFNLSITTVRKALDLLVNDGVIERLPGSGTFVRRPDFGHSFIRFTRLFGSAGDRRIPKSRVLKRDIVVGPPEIAAALALPDDAQLIRLLRLRIYEGEPVTREEIWLDAARFAAILKIEEDTDLLYPVYEDECGEIVARVEETITVEQAGPADVEFLKLNAGAPVVRIERRALGYDDRPIEWRCSRTSAHDFCYTVNIR